VIGMHTVGHASDHDPWEMLSAGVSSHAVDAATAEGTGPWLTDAAPPCDRSCGTAVPGTAFRASGSDPAPGGANLVIVCLAVLFGVGVLAMLASAFAGRRRIVPRAAAACTAGSPGAIRALVPGLVPGFALHLVDVAVLRT
jgi:hypothetical protein